MAMKRCGWCGQLKPPAEFHRNRATKDGLQNKCRLCNIAVAKQFHADNAEHCRERIGKWIRRRHLFCYFGHAYDASVTAAHSPSSNG